MNSEHDPAQPPDPSSAHEARLEFENFFQRDASEDSEHDALDAPRLTLAQQVRRARLRRGVAVLVTTLGVGSLALFASRGFEPAPLNDSLPVRAVSVAVGAARAEPVSVGAARVEPVSVGVASVEAKPVAASVSLERPSTRPATAVTAKVKVARSARWSALALRQSRAVDTGRVAEPSRADEPSASEPRAVASEPPTASFPAEHP